DAPVKVTLAPLPGDNTARVQAAIDYVALQPPDARGIRGAVLLLKGPFDIGGALTINTSGVVLRGQGTGANGSVLIASGLDRRTLVTIAGRGDREMTGKSIAIAAHYVPVNAMQLPLDSAASLKVGDTVIIRRPCTREWIDALGMRDLGGGMGNGWRPGSRELAWDRTITAINGNTITIDAPITCALDPNFGGGTVTAYKWPGRISQIGIEGVRCESTFDPKNAKDEAHSWIAIAMDNVRDAWVRQVTFSGFAGSAVTLLDSTSRITVQDCKSLSPVSEIGGYRRHTFYTAGQQTLFERCYSERGWHDFAAGFCAPGPNAFVQCEATDALNDSGPIDSWACGTLYDNVRVDGAALSLGDRRYNNFFAGWAAANSVIWQCNASVINCFDPPGAHNWCFASWGVFNGDAGFWASDNTVAPASLYYGQLVDRRGPSAERTAFIMPRNSQSSRNPTLDNAAKLTAESVNPAPSFPAWIDAATQRTPLDFDAHGAKSLDEIAPPSRPVVEKPRLDHHVTVTNGWLTDNRALVIGARQGIKWWRGGIRPDEVAEAEKDGPNPTRFVPGRIGPGLTDDLKTIADQMIAGGRVALDYHYGLWYDIRSIDHERVRRINGDVWPPFYEMPFARTGGNELDWNGLSKFDLTQYNAWYWSRLKQLADIFDQRGLVLFNENFFQHNLLEAGAHWASCPWRSANNINNMGFPEPPPYAGDKLIFMADQFYDETNPNRRPILRAYIRKCLDNFADNSNVIQFTSAEYTGPAHFMRFWLDTIGEWEKERGRHPMIGLAAPKDVQDEVLAEPARAAVVDVIDIRYWWYQPNGELYAPPGGKNLSPRQWSRGPKFPNFESAYRAVREVRSRFPDKAVLIGPEAGSANFPWAVLMGGGSMPPFKHLDAKLATLVATMRPIDSAPGDAKQWMLGDGGKSFLIYCQSNEPAKLDLPRGGAMYSVSRVNLEDGSLTAMGDAPRGEGIVEIKNSGANGPYALLVQVK
ncbi:MAG TPA: DUF6298 domain-containing protein, partial [Tepidisphaeraceae bacterium]|nr:DUF6298 domain-containing protein [Tepidisphaeraceae bacterium]